MPRLLLASGLITASLVLAGPALAQSLPLGSFIDAIGRAQGAGPRPEAAPPVEPSRGRAAPAGRNAGSRTKPVRRPSYEAPADSGRNPRGYLLGNG
jgi:hypothetical protein